MPTISIHGQAANGSLEVRTEVVGFDAALAAIEGYGYAGFRAFVGAAYREMEATMTESKEIVPVETGNLRASGHVESPKITGDTFEIVAGYGGSAAPYALRQHEDLTLRHKEGKTAKFLEIVSRRRGATVDERIAADIRSELHG